MPGVAFGRVGCGNAGESHRSDAEKFADQGHGVGGELAAAGACSRARGALEGFELGIGHRSASVHPDAFVDVLNGDGVTLEGAGSDRAAVKNQAGNVEASEGHDAAGNSLVAANQNDERIEKISARYQLDGVGNDFAAHQGHAHAFSAHGDAVGDGYGVEFEGSSAGGADAFFYVFSELAEMVIAGADFDPGVGDANERLGEVVVAEAASAKHGARAGAVGAVNQSVTAWS